MADTTPSATEAINPSPPPEASSKAPLTDSAITDPNATPREQRHFMVPFLIGMGVLVIVLIMMLFFLFDTSSSQTSLPDGTETVYSLPASR